MSERTNKHLTSDTIVVTVQGALPKKFTIARNKKAKLIAMLQSLESHVDESDMVPAEEVFKDIDKKYGKVGATIRGCRVRDGLTQNDLALKLGIHQVHISQIENGRRTVGKLLAHKLAKVFHTDYRLFL